MGKQANIKGNQRKLTLSTISTWGSKNEGNRHIFGIIVNTAFKKTSLKSAGGACGLCVCMLREDGVGPGLPPFASAASQQHDVVYGPSCPLWVCLWIPIEWRIMATPGKASQKQHLHHCTLACLCHNSAHCLCFWRERERRGGGVEYS